MNLGQTVFLEVAVKIGRHCKKTKNKTCDLRGLEGKNRVGNFSKTLERLCLSIAITKMQREKTRACLTLDDVRVASLRTSRTTLRRDAMEGQEKKLRDWFFGE